MLAQEFKEVGLYLIMAFWVGRIAYAFGKELWGIGKFLYGHKCKQKKRITE